MENPTPFTQRTCKICNLVMKTTEDLAMHYQKYFEIENLTNVPAFDCPFCNKKQHGKYFEMHIKHHHPRAQLRRHFAYNLNQDFNIPRKGERMDKPPLITADAVHEYMVRNNMSKPDFSDRGYLPASHLDLKYHCDDPGCGYTSRFRNNLDRHCRKKLHYSEFLEKTSKTPLPMEIMRRKVLAVKSGLVRPGLVSNKYNQRHRIPTVTEIGTPNETILNNNGDTTFMRSTYDNSFSSDIFGNDEGDMSMVLNQNVSTMMGYGYGETSASLMNMKSYECDYCGACFPTPSKLTRHAFIHSGEKPYLCDQCDKGFTQSQHLKQHVRSHHTPNGFVHQRMQNQMSGNHFMSNNNQEEGKSSMARQQQEVRGEAEDDEDSMYENEEGYSDQEGIAKYGHLVRA